MDSILASSRSSLLFVNPITHASLSPFSRTRRVRLGRRKHSELLRSQSKFQLVRCKFSSYGSPRTKASSSERAEAEASLLKCVARQIALALVCVAVGFAPIRTGVRGGAIAAPATAEVAQRKEKASVKGDEYREFTRKFLKTVSLVLKAVEEAREGDDGGVKEVEAAMAAVRARKEELGKEIGEVHYKELKKLRDEKEPLEKRSEEIVAVAMKKDDAAEEMSQLEKEYDAVSERLGELEDQIMRREISVVNVLEELSFIQSECELLVSSFKKELRLKSMQCEPKAPITKLSRSDIQKELETVRRKSLEEAILPKVLEEDDIESFVGKDSVSFGQRIKQCVEDSRNMQINAEAQIRRSMKKFGDEKRFVVNTPEKEVVRGYPEVELKWMFGEKEVVPPKAAKLNLYNGWKKWREEAKEETKKKMLEDVEFGRRYVAQRQERILVDRDRVVAKTWYNEEKDRWEMDPSVVPFAVSNKLVEYARIRHDWGIMYLAIKGDIKEYFVDLMEFDLLYEDFGGFDGIYMKMIAAGVPTVVQPMWIPFSELDIRQQFRMSLSLFRSVFDMFLNEEKITLARNFVHDTVLCISDGMLMIVVFPLLDCVIPYQLRVKLGMTWPEEVGEFVETSRYLAWQAEVEQRHLSRIEGQGGIVFFFSFVATCAITGYVLVHVLRFVKERVLPLIGLGPYRRDPTQKKIQRLIQFGELRKKKIEQIKREGTDPISRAFERMKRVKDPPITLNEFAGIESMREELNEVVAFLQNPRAFQEMGARAPRGVLIVGERGTGKTSLALAIAAEARVPLVEVKSQELEAGLWVGQSASNVRELFQTARDLAPVIIFVEDFDLFAGVRGTFIDTQNQDHEALINQLLVELDGFEKQDGVVLMATTRHLQKIDEALRRPGRMDRIFHLQRPTQNEREKILKAAAKETMDSELIDFVDWKKVAEKTALMLPAELKFVPLSLEYNAFRNSYLDVDELLGYSSFFATFSGFVPKWVWKTGIAKRLSKMLVNHLGLTLTKEDLQSVVDLMEPYGQISNGIELLSPPIDWTRETKFPHAVWAAGRGLIALLLPNFDVVDNLWLEPTSWQGIGCTKITKAKNESSLNGNPESRSYLEKKLVFCFGSHIASQMLLPFGQENLLSSSELQQAQEIATRMVIEYGWGPDDSPAIYYHNNASTAMSMGDKYQYEMAEKVEKTFDLAYLKAKEMMQTNRKVLEKIVEELLEFEILSGKDLENLLESNGGIKMKEPFFLSKAYDKEPSSRSFIDIENTSTTNLLTGATQT